MRRLTPATVTLLMFGVVGLLVAMYVAKGLLATEGPKPPRTRNMPMPISDIPAGTLIREDHLGSGPLFETKLTRDMLMSSKAIVGRIANTTLKKATPITGEQLYEYGTTPPLKVSEGLRAYTLDIGPAVQMVDGLVKPGDYVDVAFAPTLSDTRMRGGLIMTLFKGMKILAINRQYRQGRIESQNTVTLEVTPEEANIFNLARAHGVLSFTYTPDGKGKNLFAFKDSTKITLEELLGLPPEEKKPEPKIFRAQVYRQVGRQELEFDEKGVRRDGSGDYVPPVPVQDNVRDQVVPTYPGYIPAAPLAPLGGAGGNGGAAGGTPQGQRPATTKSA